MSNSDFHKILQGVIDKKILKVNVGDTGSIFSIDIGNELVKKEEGGQVFYEGQFVIMVYCSWRLFDARVKKPITSWHEDSRINGPLTLGLKDLLDDVVEDVLLTTFHDVVIIFKSGKVLSVFCDLTANVDADTNWFFGANGKYYSVNNLLEVIAE